MRRAAWAPAVAMVLALAGCGGGEDRPDGPHRLVAEQVLVMPDGRVIVAGASVPERGSGCFNDLAIAGLDARGRVDAGFGDRGTQRKVPAGQDCVTSVNQLERDPRGRILVGTTVHHPSESSLFGLGEDSSSQGGDLTRLTARGAVDAGFSGDDYSGFAFGVSPDGSIFDDYGTRYGADGRRDPDFRFNGGVDLEATLASGPDGAKWFLGVRDRRVYRTIAVTRLDARFKRDRRFGRDGIATADAAPGRRIDGHPEFLRLLPTPDGGAIATGVASGTRSYAFAIKFTAAGRLDRRFGDRGRVELGPAGRSSEDVYDVAPTPGGGLAAVGSAGEDRRQRLFVLRLDARGRPDPRFGRRGTVSLDLIRPPRSVDARSLNRANRGAAVSAGPRGTIVATVWLTGGRGEGVVRSLVLRLRRSGALDASFGRRGIARVGRLG